MWCNIAHIVPSRQQNLIEEETHCYGFINDVKVQDTRDKTSSNSLDLVWPCVRELYLMTPEQGVSRNKEDYFWCKLVRTQGSFFLTDILFLIMTLHL
jgi:hypothetical protein